MMSVPLSSQDREKLAKLLAMFSSDFDGEVVNAARSAERLIKARGETWESVLVPPSLHAPRPERRREPPREQPKKQQEWGRNNDAGNDTAFHAEIAACLTKADLLTPWEREFLGSIAERWSLSEKQREILDRIKAKLAKFEDMTW